MIREACRRTCKGRVVYNRKKNPFRFKDGLRIARKVFMVLRVSMSQFEQLLAYFEGRQLMDMIQFPGFGGGQFGGGGATRDVGSGSGEESGSTITNMVGILVYFEVEEDESGS